MQRNGVGRAGLNIAAGAHLKGDAPIPNVCRQAAEDHLGRIRRGRVVALSRGAPREGGTLRSGGNPNIVDNPNVVDDAHAVPEAVGAAPLDRLPDARQPEGLTCMDGEVGILAAEILERVEVPGRWEPGLRPCDVEAGDPLVAIAHDESGDLGSVGGMAHCRQQGSHPDPLTQPGGDPLAVAKAGIDGLNHLLQRQPVDQMLFGGITHLGIDHSVCGKILHALAGNPVQGIRGLHDRQRLLERLQVTHQRTRAGAVREPGPERVCILCRKSLVANGLGELDDRLRAQSAVEVIVQQRLRRTSKDVVGGHTVTVAPRPCVS